MLRPQAFRRALANVIDNALRYGKRCEVRVFKAHHHAVLFFDDEGPGIAKEFHETVFQPFKRLEPSRNSQTGGVGLGLTIVQDIVHTHGGEVELLDAPSGGLRVKISLPL
jgi:two-component system osmolarity sensor histidine kinase EnvZ